MTSQQVSTSSSVLTETVMQDYRDATLTGGVPDALIGPAETSVWQREAGFLEW
jgi:hypothetical protein